MQPNKILPKGMQVRKLAHDEVVYYKLIESDNDSATMRDESGRVLKKKPSLSLAPFTRIFVDGDYVVIGNVDRVVQKKDDKTDTIKQVEVCKSVKFIDGMLEVKGTQQALYEYLERHNANADNPFRMKSKPARFYRVDRQKAAIKKENHQAILVDAISWVKEADAIEMKVINKALPDTFKINLDSPDAKSQLFDLALKDPVMVMRGSNNHKVRCQIHVMEAEKYQIIIFNPENRCWFFNDAETTEIVTLDPGVNRYEGLVNFFAIKENRNKYTQITKKLEKYISYN